MKDPIDRTKVVLRHLPPAISQSALMEQIDGKFSGCYNWASFRPGKNSNKNQRYSCVHIDFKKAEDVFEFAELFDGHVFVNEKGAQFKALVEYAPSQRVPNLWSKKDGREGTISKDPEYLEFLEHLSKPVENLPSAEIQLERREAERAGGPKETLIVTPLMEFIRQKRAAKNGSQRSSANGKISRRARGASPNNNSSSKQGSDKRKYVLRDSTKNSSGKDKATYILVPRKKDQLVSDKSVYAVSASGTEVAEDGSGSGGVEIGKRRVVLLKGKEKEISHNQRNDATERIIRSILSNKDARQSRSSLVISQSEQQNQAANMEKDKRPPRPPNSRPILKDLIDGSHRHFGRRGSAYGLKEADGSQNFYEGKPSKRGVGYGSHERQVWVQKSGSGS